MSNQLWSLPQAIGKLGKMMYTQRQQVSGLPIVNLDVHGPPVSVPKIANSDESTTTSVPGAAPKA